MSELGALTRKELRRLTASEMRELTRKMLREIAHLRRVTADHERRLHAMDAGSSITDKARAPSLVSVRKRLKISKVSLALLLGVHRNTIRRLEAKRNPELRVSVAESLARAARMTRALAIRELRKLKKT